MSPAAAHFALGLFQAAADVTFRQGQQPYAQGRPLNARAASFDVEGEAPQLENRESVSQAGKSKGENSMG